jgi:MiaB/RimO family radical SAM methylthiotransferase
MTGCLPLISNECLNHADKVIGTQSINKINETIKGIKNSCFKEFKKNCCFYEIKGTSSVIIPIAEGCIGNCTYCAARIARKQLRSFEIKDIISNLQKAIDLGFKEIQLTSQDLSVYGLDKGKLLLPKLLKELIKVRGDFKIKLGMMNPKTTKKILKPLLKIYESNKLYKFIHIPLQSGDNEVLSKMKRNYKAQDFVLIAKEFRKKFKDGIVATDVIVGHPLENEKAFNNTI